MYQTITHSHTRSLADDVQGFVYGRSIIFRTIDDGYSKMVLTQCDGTKIRSGYVDASSQTWQDTGTWLDHSYYIQGFHLMGEVAQDTVLPFMPP